MNFVNLHCHTGWGSPFDGLDTPKEMVDAAIAKGMNCIAITEHGNLNSLGDFIQYVAEINKQRKEEGIEPFKAIYGMEGYYIDDLDEWKRNYDLLQAWKDAKLIKKAKRVVDVELDTTSEDITDVDDEGVGGWVLSVPETPKPKRISKAKKAAIETISDLPIEPEQPPTIIPPTKEELLRVINIVKEKRHILLLAKNETGLKNLYKICSYSHDEPYFYRFPRLDFKMLQQYHEGLICSTACLRGLLGTLFFNDQEAGLQAIFDRINEVNVKFKALFGDNYYNEIQFNAVEGQNTINQLIIASAIENEILLIATVDAHFPRQEQWVMRQMYSKMKWLKSDQDAKIDWPDSVDEMPYQLWVKDSGEVLESYKKYNPLLWGDVVQEAINNTAYVASTCENFVPDRSIQLPLFTIPEGVDPNELLLEKAYEGICRLGLDQLPQYQERFGDEIEVITFKNFAPYFLTMKEITDRARSRFVCGASRGSSAGSLIAYCLGITEIDPIQFGLDFNRFLTKGTKGSPDIDFDIANAKQFKAELIEEWGKHRVVQVSTWTRLQFKSLIKDVAKFYKIPFQEVNKVTMVMEKEITEAHKRLDEESDSDEENDNEEFFKIGLEHLPLSRSYTEFLVKYPMLRAPIESLLGQVRSVGAHAGGVIVGDDLYASMPLIQAGHKMQTPWPESGTVKTLEHMGQVKFDLLGLSTLSMIQDCIKYILVKNGIEPIFENIKEFYDTYLSPRNLALDDQSVWEKIWIKGWWLGIFQFTSKGAQEFAQTVSPTNIDELASITSIYRPGPIGADVHNQYANTKYNDSAKYLNDIHKEITQNTYGFLVFQEQLAALVSRLGKGISADEGHYVRKLLTSKGDKQRIEAETYHSKFLEGCFEHQMTPEQSERLWADIVLMGGYAFNKSHAVAYSLISYMCGWLATHAPTEWAAAYLNKDLNAPSKLEQNISKVRKYGFEIKPVDVNVSGLEWIIDGDGDALVQPLTSIKGLGDKVAQSIIDHRPIKYFEQFIDGTIPRNEVNKRTLAILVRAGALDDFLEPIPGYKNKQQLLDVIENGEYKNWQAFLNLLEKNDFTDFSRIEKIDQQYKISGIYPMELVCSDEKYAEMCRLMKTESNFLDIESVMALEEQKEEDSRNRDRYLVWFVLRDFEVAETKKEHKKYYKCSVSNYNGVTCNLTVWLGEKNRKVLHKHQVYITNAWRDWQGIASGIETMEIVE